MALVFINGFDDQILSASTVGTFSPTFNTSSPAGRTGTTSMGNTTGSGLYGANVGLLAVPGAGDATVVLGSAMQFSTTAMVLIWVFYSDAGSTQHVTVAFDPSTGALTCWRGNNSTGTVIGTATLSGSALLTNTWGYWEVKATLSDTVGEVHVRYNQTAVLDVTGVDTKNAGTKTVFDSVSYPMGRGPNATFVDDFYLVTGTGAPNNFLGDCKVNTIYPTGNGDYSQLLGSDGDSTNNYLLVNEAGAPVTTSYVESDTVGQRDFYAMGDISIPSNATVLGVQVSAYCNNPDAGTGRAVKVGVRQGTSEALTASLPLTAATFLADRGVFTVDPATGAAWSQSGVNSVQAGMEVA